MIERVKIAIEQTEAILNAETNPTKKEKIAATLASMKSLYQTIVDNNWPCPDHLVESVDKALKAIEKLYNKTACN